MEFQVLVRHSENLLRVLNELTGGARKQALYVPDTVVRYDYSLDNGEQASVGLGCIAEERPPVAR